MTSPTQLQHRFHPVHAILLAFPIALFVSAFVSDVTYLNSGEVQWSNISQWAIAGALIFGAPVLVWAFLLWLRGRGSSLQMRNTIYLGLSGAMWLLGLVNAFKHSQDAWSSVGVTGVLLSAICAALALIAGWLFHSSAFQGEPK